MKRAVIRSNFFCGAMQSKARSGCHVTTSRRHQVTTSGQHCRSQQFSNVATSPRRDVSSKNCISSFNVRTARKLGHWEAYQERHGFPEPEDPDFERVPDFCTAFHFLTSLDIMMMFLTLDILFFSFMMF